LGEVAKVILGHTEPENDTCRIDLEAGEGTPRGFPSDSYRIWYKSKNHARLASAPASVDRAAAEVVGGRFFGQNGKKSRPKNPHAVFAPLTLEEPGAPES
jgi:hypothetical protein